MMVTPVPIALVSNDPEIADLLSRMPEFRAIGLFDCDPGAICEGLPVLGDDGAWEKARTDHPGLKLVMALDPTALKARLAVQYGMENFVRIVAPDAYVARSATVGEGTMVQSGARIMAASHIGRLCKIALDATIHHDCNVADFCTVAPGARLLGKVLLERGAYIGSGATVLSRVRIGADAMVGAGAVVTRDVAAGTTVIGVPARKKI